MIRRLRIKFVCIVMAIVTVMLCVIFGLVLHFTRTGMERESIQMLQRLANEPPKPGRPDELPGEVRLPYFSIAIGRQGELLADGWDYYDLSDEAFLRELIQLCENNQTDTGTLPGYSLRYCCANTPMGQRFVFADISSEQAALKSLLRNCVIIGILSFFLLLGTSVLLARWAVKPVAEAWQQQRQFVADASHELKTPLTVILANAELLQDPEYDAHKRSDFARNILSMAIQMRGLTESLLELARTDHGRAGMTFTRVELSALLQDAVLPFEPVYFENGLTLEQEIDEPVYVQGSGEHLRQVVDILLDNAAKYSHASGTVSVKLKRQDHTCLLRVSNPGDPLSGEERQKIFMRFYRGDEARRMNHSYGLGLAIAKSIVTQHKGKIWAESRDGCNCFLVQLPLSSR